jgi:hypothetical protein
VSNWPRTGCSSAHHNRVRARTRHAAHLFAVNCVTNRPLPLAAHDRLFKSIQILQHIADITTRLRLTASVANRAAYTYMSCLAGGNACAHTVRVRSQNGEIPVTWLSHRRRNRHCRVGSRSWTMCRGRRYRQQERPRSI